MKPNDLLSISLQQSSHSTNNVTNMADSHSRERNGCDGEDFQNKEDDKRIAVHENSTKLEHDSQYCHRD